MGRMERFFNTAGPNNPEDSYTIDPLSRFDLDDILMLIRQKKYFVLHAPRQTGKTSCMLALRDYLNKEGDYIAVYANVEGGQASRNDKMTVVKSTVDTLTGEISLILKNNKAEVVRDAVQEMGADSMLSQFLSLLCQSLEKPLVLILDEIDALVGDSLVAVLRQIRSGYANRPAAFPQTIILCGVRDVRDYRIVLSNQDIVTGGSAFNIKAESLRLGNFTKEEIHELYMQHTRETGQEFDEACFPMVWDATEGQPWLVNALAYEVTWKMKENRDRSIRIIPEMIYRAQERIIYRRDTHIDILIYKLQEPRVKRVIEPILANSEEADEGLIPSDDVLYVQDMGLIAVERGKPRRIANGIYREIIPRELTWSTQDSLVQQPQWYQRPDGRIDVEKLLLDFQQFFRQNSDSWIQKFDYAEAGPQLLLQAFLQRIVNGGGYIDREYGLGRKRTDLLIRKPLTEGYGGPVQRVVLELKIKREALETVIEKGLQQTAEYMDLVGAVDEGHLIIFDRSNEKTWEERIWHRSYDYQGRTIVVWGM
ncbi:MAG: AAA-like domain-containing protein [Bacteroidaceae bacterium]|nr:AAA-like domain-containing protein [Bacteroidaceae bacterium]